MFELITIAILILSIVFHEVAHGYAANWLGDPTARLAGRLTPNPVVHIDPLGSVIIPAFLFLSHAPFLFGWAKPVPYNPYNLRNGRWSESIVAAAGPLANLFLALVFALLIRFAVPLHLSGPFIEMSSYIVFINVLLGLFNAIPLPPLDGSKIIAAFFPGSLEYRYRALVGAVERIGLLGLFLMVFIFMQVLWQPFSALVTVVFRVLTGL
ncbi:MAG TPA: site-2 protease family protein [Candidatus Paceibacterota bacterium]|nr:site-2 protease family protein [Candidatus Paceibacterota bacterium]